MRYTCALLLCLVLGSFAVQTDETFFRLQQIEKTRFGKTLLDTIQLQLESGDPVDNLIAMLEEMEDSIDREQKEDDAYINALQAECEADRNRLESEINQAETRSQELQDELDEKIPLRDEKKRQREAKIEFKGQVEARITELDIEKKDKDAEWAQEQEEHDKATYVITRAKEIIQGGFSEEASFLQRNKPIKVSKESLVQVSEHLMTNAKKLTFKRKSWNAIFKVLAKITASAPVQADMGAVQKIIELCDSLLSKIAESRDIERQDYENWVATYTTTREEEVNKLNTTIAELANLEQEINTLTKRINNARLEKEEQDQRAAEKSVELQERNDYCDDESMQYADRRQQRNDDRNIISEVIGIIEAKLRVLKKYVADRMQE